MTSLHRFAASEEVRAACVGGKGPRTPLVRRAMPRPPQPGPEKAALGVSSPSVGGGMGRPAPRGVPGHRARANAAERARSGDPPMAQPKTPAPPHARRPPGSSHGAHDREGRRHRLRDAARHAGHVRSLRRERRRVRGGLGGRPASNLFCSLGAGGRRRAAAARATRPRRCARCARRQALMSSWQPLFELQFKRQACARSHGARARCADAPPRRRCALTSRARTRTAPATSTTSERLGLPPHHAAATGAAALHCTLPASAMFLAAAKHVDLTIDQTPQTANKTLRWCVKKYLKSFRFPPDRRTGFSCPRGNSKKSAFPEPCRGKVRAARAARLAPHAAAACSGALAWAVHGHGVQLACRLRAHSAPADNLFFYFYNT